MLVSAHFSPAPAKVRTVPATHDWRWSRNDTLVFPSGMRLQGFRQEHADRWVPQTNGEMALAVFLLGGDASTLPSMGAPEERYPDRVLAARVGAEFDVKRTTLLLKKSGQRVFLRREFRS